MIIWVFSLHLTSHRKTRMIILANPIFADGGRDQLDQLRDPEDEFWKVKSCKHLQRELRTTTHSNNNSAPSSVQFSSVAQSCLTLCNPMDCITPGFPVHHQLPVCSNSCPSSQWCHSPSSPSPPVFNLSQQQDLFKWVSSFHQVAKVLELQLQHQSFQWIFRTDFL